MATKHVNINPNQTAESISFVEKEFAVFDIKNIWNSPWDTLIMNKLIFLRINQIE